MHQSPDPPGRRAQLLDQDQRVRSPRWDGTQSVVTLDNLGPIARSRTGDASFKCLPYQLAKGGDMPPLVVTGNGESGFDSGEGA